MKTLKDVFGVAYLQLLREHSPKHITVKQIVLEANASRSSFYTHFDSKEQLHSYVKEQIQKEFLAHYQKSGNANIGKNPTFTLCQHIIKYRSYYQYAFQDATVIHDMSIELSEYLMRVYEDKDYAIFASFGTIGYLKNWAEEGFVISPSEASEKLLKIGFTNWASKVRKPKEIGLEPTSD